MTRPKLKAAYDNFDKASDETGLACMDESLAQQHQKDETDINNIVKMYLRTGELPIRRQPPMQGDFTNAPDMQTAMNLLVAAKDAFMDQPAEIRARFNNNPALFVDFCSDPTNKPEMRKMGLLSTAAMQEMDEAQALADELAYRKRREAEDATLPPATKADRK